MNSIGGIGGLIDIATPAGLPEHPADFGGTLHRYGTPSGPYLVVPVLGPSTARDAAGDLVDAVLVPQRYLLSATGQIVLGTGSGISARTEHGDGARRRCASSRSTTTRAAHRVLLQPRVRAAPATRPPGPSETFLSSADDERVEPVAFEHRRVLRAAQRQLRDRPAEVDVDHAPAGGRLAHAVVELHGLACGECTVVRTISVPAIEASVERISKRSYV